MKEELIKTLLKSGILRRRQLDKERIKSVLNSAKITVNVVKRIPLNEESATLIFREIYESIRQLGDAKWWIKGYEPLNHDISLESLKEANIKEKFKLNHLERFKKIRHDANYKGFKVLVSQAKEILSFWEDCGKEVLDLLLKKVY